MRERWSMKDARKPSDAPTLSVGFILARRFTLNAFANFIDVLRLAADEGDRSRPIRCEWSVLSHSMHPLASSSGVMVEPNERLGDPGKFDYIAVVGGIIGEIHNLDPEYVRYLQRAAALKVPLIGVCTGAFILHHAGLMDGYRCCVSWFHHADFLEQFDGLQPVSDQIFIVDRDRLTCPGGASSAHLAAFLVERHIGRKPATKSLRIMMINEAEVEETPQPSPVLDLSTNDVLVRKALLLAQQSLDSPISVDQIAKHLGVTKRRLERHFRRALGNSPQAAFIDMRLSLARQLIQNTDKSFTTIAIECGFADSSHFSRMFRRRFASTPREFRKSNPRSAHL
ncbi:GlxA family transcriptional regulator [Phyllobacterium sp. YR531]|uniref:GlxA family transcriptional regulator n=1 Tax=Phyllobacterium sp. YR531 TaxID=1144343 RepID=UPI00026FBB25|nr:GlxA family transcriptional regulator [Phyllobacterium sp. YR531]EJN02318.1 transcriptional regulator containing an amidase domain and an AraC-type DNA-binding HTH domain [Phyllobacterium sp. YR531]